jgi:hypothetical protein
MAETESGLTSSLIIDSSRTGMLRTLSSGSFGGEWLNNGSKYKASGGSLAQRH